MNKPTCKLCLDNPNIPAGQEHEAEEQLCGAWLCRPCADRIRKVDNGVARLLNLTTAPERLSLAGLILN